MIFFTNLNSFAKTGGGGGGEFWNHHALCVCVRGGGFLVQIMNNFKFILTIYTILVIEITPVEDA